MKPVSYRLIKLAIGLLIVLLIFGCGQSKELTRAKAKELISKKYPQVVTGWLKPEFEILDNLDSHPWCKPEVNKYQQMVKEGLIILTEPRDNRLFTPTQALPRIGVIYKVKLTPSTQKYFVSKDISSLNVKIAEITFNEITGIVNDPSRRAARVEYNVEENNYTPFAKYLSSQENKGKKMKRQEQFVLYDDGWRIEH